MWFGAIAVLVFGWIYRPNLLGYYQQLIKDREPLTKDLRDKGQIEASFVGSSKCLECHEEQLNLITKIAKKWFNIRFVIIQNEIDNSISQKIWGIFSNN